MGEDLRWQFGTADHPKIKRLVAEAGESAFRCLVRLWEFTGLRHPDGKLRDMDDLDIALAAGWTSAVDAFVPVLARLQLLDGDTENYAIHDWAENQPWNAGRVVRQRAARIAGKRSAQVRAEQRLRTTVERPLNDRSNSVSVSLPSPSPTPTPNQNQRGGEGKGMQGGTDAPASPGASSRSARPPLPPLPSELATEAFREAWSEWLQHRRDIGHPVRPVGAKAAFGRLVPYGPERAAAVIRESIANGWRGLFPERDAGGNGRNREPEDDDRAVTKRALDLWEKQKADEAERGIRAHA